MKEKKRKKQKEYEKRKSDTFILSVRRGSPRSTRTFRAEKGTTDAQIGSSFE